ncbi:MAG: hypothetical protein Q4D38_12210 [Planctomycetia bacterium]|nr:hypothetical protein [Planctomycetia bacterium]
MARIASIQGGGLSGDHTLQQENGTFSLNRTMEIVYTVWGNSELDTPDTIIRTTAGLPTPGTSMYGLYCKKVSAKREKAFANGTTAGLWSVTATFDGEIESLEPTELPPEISWSSETYEEVLREDVEDGKKVQTKCGEPLILTKQQILPTLTIKRTENAPFDPNTILDYTNTINEKTFWGAPAGHALMAGINATYKQVETPEGEKKWYVDVTYVIKFKQDPKTQHPWRARVLHWGTKFFKNAVDEAQCLIDGSGNVSGVKLDQNGFRLADNAEPVYLEFNVYPKKDFGSLELNPDQLGSVFV